MCYADWREIFNNLFVCVDFPRHWTGIRYASEWNAECSGGTPSPMNEANKKMWA